MLLLNATITLKIGNNDWITFNNQEQWSLVKTPLLTPEFSQRYAFSAQLSQMNCRRSSELVNLRSSSFDVRWSEHTLHCHNFIILAVKQMKNFRARSLVATGLDSSSKYLSS